jgi:uncharacterized secreted protein with C-terminal beta-propeller domain
MSLADDKYVDEANPALKTKNKAAAKRKLFIALAATLAVLMSLSLWLFIPFKDANADVSQYADSEYYEVIQKLHAIGYRPPRYKNNFEKYVARAFSNIFGAKKDAAVEDAGTAENFYVGNYSNSYGGAMTNGSSASSDSATGTDTSSKYEEVTDNQVEGVIEADLIKRTDTHIFYLDGLTLRAFSIAGEESREVGSYSISTKDGFNRYGVEFYLSLDGKSVTLILPHPSSSKPFVSIERIDVSDPTNMTAQQGFCVSGHLKSTRMTNGELLVLTNFYPKMNFSEPENFVPSVGDTHGNMEALDIENLYVPENVTSTAYTVITRLDANTLEHKDSYSLLSYSANAYVSADAIYTWRGMTEKTDIEGGLQKNVNRSEIVGVSYKEPTMKLLGSIKIDGSIKDQYSLDEYKGILRVAATVNESKYQTEERNGRTVSFFRTESAVNASLYCIDISTWQTVASVERFAPEGETVRSVRFDGDSAYVCTAIEQKDPVFFFDLSDINNITYTQTGTIEGFSTSLVDFAEGYLLGIGVGANGYLKIEVYEEIDGKVVSVCKYEPPQTWSSDDYKSYYIDRENGLIGLGTSRVERYGDSYDMPVSKYTVLSFADRTLTEEFRVSLMGNHAHKRGVYVDGYFYMFGKNDFEVERLDIE